MAALKKTVVNALKTVPQPKSAPLKSAENCTCVSIDPCSENDTDKLVADNFAALSEAVAALGSTLDILVQKSASMAYHIIATEEILAEIVATHGLNLANVNDRIRAKIATGPDNGNVNQAIDVAASIASPLPRR